jgi:transposase-like protein
MGFCGVPLFRKRQFAADIIVSCVRWYLRFSLSLRDVEEADGRARLISRSHDRVAMDTAVRPRVRVPAPWASQAERIDPAYRRDLCADLRPLDEAAKCFLKRALANPDNRLPHVFARDRLRSYPAAIRELQQEGQLPSTVDIEPNATRIIASNPTTVILNDACARCRVHERRRPRVWLLRESK